MGLDERLFGWFYRTLNRRKSQAPGVSEHAVTLEPLRARFSLLASALAGVSVEVKVAERVGGVRGHHLLLPAVVDRYDSPERNLEVYLHRVAFGAESMRMGFSTAGLPAAPFRTDRWDVTEEE